MDVLILQDLLRCPLHLLFMFVFLVLIFSNSVVSCIYHLQHVEQAKESLAGQVLGADVRTVQLC